MPFTNFCRIIIKMEKIQKMPAKYVDGNLSGIGANDNANTVNTGDNTTLEWEFSEAREISNIRLFTSNKSTARTQISVSSVSIKQSGSDEWITLANSSVKGALAAKNYKANYEVGNGVSIADNVTHLRIVLGETKYKYVFYSEIEVGYLAKAALTSAVTVKCPAELGSVSTDIVPSATEGDAMVFPLGKTVKFTATPTDGVTFIGWHGIKSGQFVTDNPIEVAVDNDMTFTALFAKDWVYDNNKLTDGYWQLTTATSNGRMNITKAAPVFSPAPLLDLGKPVKGTDAVFYSVDTMALEGNSIYEIYFADSIVSIGYEACREMSTLRKVQLPENLETLGHCVFWGCKALSQVSPMLPKAFKTFSGTGHFSSCPISGKLEIASSECSAIAEQSFSGTQLSDVDLSKSGVTTINKEAFLQTAKKLKNVYLPNALNDIRTKAFQLCNDYCSLYFASKPASIASDAFENVPNTARVVFYKNDSGWVDYLDGISTFTAWEDVADATKKKYTYADECEPYGTAKIYGASNPLFIATRKSPVPQGTILLIH